MDGFLSHLRRSRLRSFARRALHLDAEPRHELAAEVNISDLLIRDQNGVGLDGRAVDLARLAGAKQLEKRSVIDYTPEQLSSLRSAASVSAALAHSTSNRAAAQAATLGTTITSRSYAVTRTASAVSRPTASVQGSTSSTAKLSSVAATNSSVVPSASITHSSSNSTLRVGSSSSTTHSTSSTPTVITITSDMATSTSSSVTASFSGVGNSTADASTASTSSSSLSTGGIVGVVLAVLVGLVVVGSAVGWLYRKFTSRAYSTKAPWSKIDDNITPFPYSDKPDNNDVYGASAAPVIGSRRALAMARQNAFNADGSFRTSEYGSNRAGVGAGIGAVEQHSAYSQTSPTYGVDPQGRPYNPHSGRTPMMHTVATYGATGGQQAQSRQLVGSHQTHHQPFDYLSPVAMGRPAPPTTHDELSQAEDFADMPGPHSAGYDEGYTPRTATTMDWTGDMRSAAPAPAVQLPLPALAPLSPLMSGFDLQRRSQVPQLALYTEETEQDRQKRLYGEVARAAGVAEPKTPHATTLNHSTSSGADTSYGSGNITSSSFSAPERTLPPQRLPPAPVVTPPQPYVHGRPLSPLAEVPTPKSSTVAPLSSVPLASSSVLHEPNPFDRLSPPGSIAPPYSAIASPMTAASGAPSAAYPPPSPGRMSVPGSVTDSPRAWTPATMRTQTRGDDFFDDEDAYGGI